MRNSCAKNVFFVSINGGLICDLLFTNKYQGNILPHKYVNKLGFIHIFSEFKTHNKSTTKNPKFKVLNKAYTHSPHSLLLPLLMKFKERL